MPTTLRAAGDSTPILMLTARDLVTDNLGRDVLRAPGVFQIDTALAKNWRLGDGYGLEFGIQGFNIHESSAPGSSRREHQLNQQFRPHHRASQLVANR